jgi:Carbohydrate esterase, sialic acid-specific acetylesterase
MQKYSINPLVFFLFIIAFFLISTIYAENSINNLTQFQVIQRTSETYADIPVFGYHDFSIGSHIQARICLQTNNEVLNNFNWITVDTSFSSMTWKGVIRHVPVGGEYIVQFKLLIFENLPAKPFATVEHVLVGDIWGAGGQSNMLGEGDTSLSDKPIDQVHMITYGNGWQKAREPIGGVGCGPALRFALRVFSATGVPIGLAYHAVGGTSMNFWKKGAEGFEKWTSVFDQAGNRLKGIIWYQGEKNQGALDSATSYKNSMKEFMGDIRNYLNNTHLPWILAQISTNCEVTNDTYAPIVREAQREISIEDSNAATITTIDLPRQDCYHFQTPQYQTMGERFASAALNKAYGEKSAMLGPRFYSACFTDSANTGIVVFLKTREGGIKVNSINSGFVAIDRGANESPSSAMALDSNVVRLTFTGGLSANATLNFGFGDDPANFNCSDTSNIVLQGFYNQSVLNHSEIPKQQNYASGQNVTGATGTNSTVEITIKENPFKMHALLLISFSEIKSTFAGLSIYRFDGALVRHIKLSLGQDRLTISGKFLPPGCYIFSIQDGKAMGSKKTLWNGR